MQATRLANGSPSNSFSNHMPSFAVSIIHSHFHHLFAHSPTRYAPDPHTPSRIIYLMTLGNLKSHCAIISTRHHQIHLTHHLSHPLAYLPHSSLRVSCMSTLRTSNQWTPQSHCAIICHSFIRYDLSLSVNEPLRNHLSSRHIKSYSHINPPLRISVHGSVRFLRSGTLIYRNIHLSVTSLLSSYAHYAHPIITYLKSHCAIRYIAI